MKKHELLALTVFVLGLMTKTFKMPGHTIVLAFGTLYWIVVQVIELFRKRALSEKWQVARHLVGFATGCWMLYLLTVLKFLPQQNIFLGIAAIISIGTTAYSLSYKSKLKTQIALFALLVLVSSGLSMVPKHQLYFALNVKYNKRISKDFRTLDKYSWFLTRAEKYDLALQTNLKAQKAAEVAIGLYDLDPIIMEKLEIHRNLIQKQNWKDYEKPI